MSLNTGALVASAAGITGSAWLAGNTMGISMLTTPAMLSASTSSHWTLAVWATLYNRGKSQNPKIAVATLAGYAYAAYASHSRGLPWTGLLAAGALTVALVPWTLAFMMPTNNRLLALAATSQESEPSQPQKTGGEAARELQTVNALLTTWTTLNFVRGLWPLAGAAVGLATVLA